MPYVPAPGICQAEMFFVWDGQECEYVFHFEPSAALTPTIMEELGEHLVDWWDTAFKSTTPSTMSLVGVKLTDLTTNTAPVVNYSTGLPIAGTSSSPSMPNNVALVITKRTVLRGRSYRGRIYHMGLVESHVTDNQVTPAQVVSFVSNYRLLENFSTTGATWDMVVVSRRADGDWRTVADSNQVVSMDSNGRVMSQRRRLPR